MGEVTPIKFTQRGGNNTLFSRGWQSMRLMQWRVKNGSCVNNKRKEQVMWLLSYSSLLTIMTRDSTSWCLCKRESSGTSQGPCLPLLPLALHSTQAIVLLVTGNAVLRYQHCIALGLYNLTATKERQKQTSKLKLKVSSGAALQGR